MHYVDDYTINSDWANPAQQTDGQWTNDFKRRMAVNKANDNYRDVNEAGKEHFDGKTSYEAQEEIGEQVEKRLAQLLSERSDQDVNHYDLPIFIDSKIKEQIDQIS